MHVKKILFITHDNNNIFIKYLVKSLEKNFKVDIYNSSKNKKNFPNKIADIIFHKIVDLFSSFNHSNKEKFYINYKISHSDNFLKRIYFILKKIINYFNL